MYKLEINGVINIEEAPLDIIYSQLAQMFSEDFVDTFENQCMSDDDITSATVYGILVQIIKL